MLCVKISPKFPGFGRKIVIFHSWNNFSGMQFGCSVDLVGNSGGVALED